jgi:hypothetical protein
MVSDELCKSLNCPGLISFNFDHMKLGFRCLAAACIVVIISCVSDRYDKPKGKVINPNGDSELALLMRNMFDDGMETKRQVLSGEVPRISVDYHHIRDAEATEPEKALSDEYMLYARAYEALADSLLVASPSNRGNAYQLMVGACMNCHQAMCPGPMVKIKKMYLSEPELARVSQNDDFGH